MSMKGVKRVKRIFEKSLLRAVFGFVIFVSSFSNLAVTAFAASPGLYDFYAKNGVLFYSANTTGCSPNGGASQGGSSPGSQSANALEQAKNVVDTLQSRGFSGAAIAGVLSNIEAEGGLTIPDRAEGHYGNDEENNGVVLSSIYGREENRCYAKPVIAGKSQYVLSKEEQEVLQQK